MDKEEWKLLWQDIKDWLFPPKYPVGTIIRWKYDENPTSLERYPLIVLGNPPKGTHKGTNSWYVASYPNPKIGSGYYSYNSMKAHFVIVGHDKNLAVLYGKKHT